MLRRCAGSRCKEGLLSLSELSFNLHRTHACHELKSPPFNMLFWKISAANTKTIACLLKVCINADVPLAVAKSSIESTELLATAKRTLAKDLEPNHSK